MDYATTPKEVFETGKLFVFDYVPNLKIVGGGHGLNEEDRGTLEELVEGSDFVAVENDRFRKKSRGNFNVLWFPFLKGYYPSVNTFFVTNPLDVFYCICKVY